MATSGAKAAASLLLVFFFVTQIHAIDKCAAGCNGATQPKDGFQQGNTYTYWLEGLANIHLSGAEKQQTEVKLSAQATVVALGNCANLLKVTSLQITANDGTKYEKPRDIDKPVRFTLQDGVLGSEICTEEGDSQYSLNIKRALLSLLQTATKHNTEVDIFGICPTTFTVNKEGNGLLVRKNRDLNFCAHREQARQDLLTYIYNPNSEIKNSHILQSSMRVDAVLKHGIVEKVEAHEDYLYRPFSVGDAGVKGSVTSKLVLRETNKGSLPAKCVVPKSIIFDNPHLVNTDHSNVANLLLALNSATTSLNGHVQEKSAAIFADLIRVFRVSSKDDIINVYSQIKSGSAVKDNNLAKNVFLDALFRTGTGDSIEVSINLLQKKELTPLQQKLVLISLGTVRHASSNSLKAATALLDNSALPNDVFLGVGALAGAYCRDHRCHGSPSDPGVVALTNKFASKIGDCKAASKKAEDMIVYALKGLRNVHHLEDSVADKLAHCAGDKNVRQRVRVAAMETFAADPCIAKLKTTALNIMKDIQQDSEVRIKAYLALLNCPDAKIAGEIKTLLDNEKIYQVGSFITSSLRNIKATTNPARQAAKEYFGSIKLTNKFPLDIRRYSHNYEVSYEVETLGIGSVAEANVIFSQNSFLPRSANLNLTAEIFGREVNLIELGLRQGNLDRVIEEYLGPHGVLRTQTPQETFNQLKKTGTTIFDKLNQRLKGAKTKRDVYLQMAELGKKLKTDVQSYHGDLDLDVFVKLFGTESIFLSLGDDQHTSIESLIDRVFDFLDSGMSDAKQFSHELRSHILFLDMELAYPSSCGLSLKLNLEGAATTKLEIGGNLDLKKILKDPKNAKVELKLVPSANIKLSGTLSIDADIIVNGLKVVANMHTSTGTHLIFKTLEGGFDMQLGLPVEKQEIVTATNEIFFYKREKGHQDVETKVEFNPDGQKEFSLCFDQLQASTGLTFCGELIAPWNDVTNKGKGGPVLLGPTFPLNGPAKFSLNIEKDQLSGFHIHGQKTSKTGQHKVELTLEAEGGKKNRKVSFSVDVSHVPQLYSVKAAMNSPQKYLEAHAALINNEHEMTISAGAKHDKDDYTFKAGLQQEGQNTYKPVLDYKLPGDQKPLSIEGTITYDKTPTSKKFTFNNICLVVSNDKTFLNGFVMSDKDGFSTDLKITSGETMGKFAGNIKTGETTKGFAQFHNTLSPEADFTLNFERVAKSDFRSMDITFVHGSDPNSKENKISTHTTIKGDLEKYENYDFQTKFTYPLQQLSYEIKSALDANKFELDAEGKYAQSKGEFELLGKKNMKKAGDLFGKLEAKVNDKGMDLEGKYEVETDMKSKFQCKLEMNPGGKYEVSGNLKTKFTPGDMDCGVVATFKTSIKPEDYKVDIGVVSNPTSYNSHFKLNAGSTNLVDGLVKVVKEPTKSGNMKLVIKDILDAQGQFKVNPDHKGNGLLLLDFTKVGRKIKMETTFFASNPQYDIAVDLYPNFGKDNAQKYTLTTNNKLLMNDFDSKNTLVISGDSTELHLQRTFTGDYENGKLSGSINFLRSDGRNYNSHWEREATTKDKDVKGSIAFETTYVPGTGKHPTKLTYNGRLISMNRETGQAEAEHHLHFVNSDEKDLDAKLHVKITPKNKRKTVDTKLEITGAICKENIALTGTYDFFNAALDEEKRDAKYKIKGSYGQKASLDLDGGYNMAFPQDGDKKLESDVNLHMVLPLDKARDLKFVSTDSLTIPLEDAKYFSLSSQKKVQINSDSYTYDASMQFAKHEGKVRLSAQIPKQDALLLETGYKAHEEKDNTHKYSSNINVEYGAGKKLQVAVDGTRQHDKEGQFTVSILLPPNQQVAAKKILTTIKYKRPESRSFSSDIGVDIDGKKYSAVSTVDMTKKDSSLIDLKFTCPENKPARFYINAQRTGEHQYRGESKLENMADFNMVLNIDAKLIAPEDFDIKVEIDAAKIKLNKIHFEAKSEPAAKGAKKINFFAKEGGKDVLSGTTTYQSKQEGHKFIMEGSGSVKIKEEQKSTSFKYVRDKIHESAESGYEVFFNVAVGENNVVIEHKATNKEYKFSSVYCEEKKNCAHIEIKNKVDFAAPNRVSQALEFDFDLRKLGFAPEFGLQASSELERFKLPVYTLGIHLSQDKSKYHAQAFAKPIKEAYQTAFILTTPHRIVSLETSTTLPSLKSKGSPLTFQHESVFFLNKNDPSTKTQLKIARDFQRVEKQHVSSSGHIIFTCPSLGKEMQITGKTQYSMTSHALNSELVLDIFKKKPQKVVMTFKFSPEVVKGEEDILKSKLSYTAVGHIDGKGVGFDVLFNEKVLLSADNVVISSENTLTIDKQKKTASWSLDATPTKQTLVMRIPSTEVLRIESSNQYNSPNFQAEVSISVLQDKTYRGTAEVGLSSPYSVNLVGGIKNDNSKVVISAKTVPMKSIEAKAEHFNGKQNRVIANFLMGTQGKLKPEITVKPEILKEIVEKVRSDLLTVIKKGENLIKQENEQVSKDYQKLKTLFQNASPDFEAVQNIYKIEFQKIADELKSDKAFEKLAETLSSSFKSASKIGADLMQQVVQVMKQTQGVISELLERSNEVWNDKLLPTLTGLVDSASHVGLQLFGGAVDIFSHYFVYLSELLDKHAADLKPALENITKLFDECVQAIEQLCKQITMVSKEFLANFNDSFSSLPIMQTIKDKLEEYDVPKTAQKVVDSVLKELEKISPTKEIRTFFEALLTYINKKFNLKSVNDIEELNTIFTKAVSAADSFLAYIRGSVSTSSPLIAPSFITVPLSFSGLTQLPNALAPKFSIINFMSEKSNIDAEDVLKAYWPRSLNPFHMIPPYKLRGLVAGGQHVFTFDSRHMTFPGTCRYVLAQDAVDGNFSIAIGLDKGSPKSVALWDKSGNIVEVNDKTQLTLNGQKYGFPVEKADIIAWKDGLTFVIETKYGAFIKCSYNLEICYVEVSGFYLGKLRGLLGDGNNEPYDDFRLPSGKISASESEFGNAYALGPNCAPVVTVDHSDIESHAHHHGPGAHGAKSSGICKKLLGEKTLLSICDVAVDIKNFRQACQHATALAGAKADEEACLIVRAYTLACQASGFMIPLPDDCATCKVDGATYQQRQDFNVKTPQKQADIVVTVETTKDNQKTYKELLLPLLSAFIDEMKTKKIDNIKVHLVGISPKLRFPILYDTEDSKLKGAKIDFKDEQRSKPWESPITTENEKYDNYMARMAKTLQETVDLLAIDNLHLSYSTLGTKMQWRPKSLKTIIMVHSESCPVAPIEIFQFLGSKISKNRMENKGIVAHLITPVEGLEAPGIKNAATIIGFNSEDVFILGDKKRGQSHTSLRGSLEFDDDQCMNYAAETFGNVYSSTSFFALNAGQRKNFIQLASHTLVDSLAAVNLESECSCKLRGIVSYVDCSVKSRKDTKKGGAKK